MPDEPGLPSAEELAVLPRGVLAKRLAEAHRVIATLTAQVQELSAQVTVLQAQVEDLQRRVGRDSSTSSRPPSSDSPYNKKGRDRSARERGKRRRASSPVSPARR